MIARRVAVGAVIARRVAAGAVIAALTLGACSGPGATPPDPGDASPAATVSARPSGPAAPESPVAGVVTRVDSRGLTDVRGFELRTTNGQLLTFVLGDLENGDEFPPGHLVEHQAAASPVLVFFRVESGELVAYRIEDAG